MRDARMRGVWAVLVLSAVGLMVSYAAADDEKAGAKDAKAAELPLCPVMGEPVDFNIRTMTDKGPVYLCCSGCIKKYDKKPEKYAEKTATQRAALEKRPRVQVACPLSGEPINPKMFVELDGKKVQFCCGDCKGAYAKNPAKYAAKLAASYTYQTLCPVMGETINPVVFTDLPTGERIYLCCKRCDKKLLGDPAKYASTLAEQGIRIDVKKLKAAKDGHAHGESGHEGHDH